MNLKQKIQIFTAGVVLIVIIVMLQGGVSHDEGEHDEHAEGQHGGILLGEEEFRAEVTIYEPNVPPQSRVYFYEDDQPIDPALVQLKIELHRIDSVDVLNYKKESDYLVGDKVVREPHSFDVKVSASYKGKSYEWEYPSYEGRVELSEEAVKGAGIVVESAGPAKLRTTAKLNGKIIPNEHTLVHISPRFAGVITELKKELGDKVEKDEVLAVIESNESLTTYDVKAKISGTVIGRNASLGEVVSESDNIYVVANLDSVWASFNVSRQDFSKIKEHQKVILNGETPETSNVEAIISYVSPVSVEETQTLIARAEIPNTEGNWKPGTYLTGNVVLEEKEVSVAVKASAIQTFKDWQVVFKQVGDLFEIAIVKLGVRDGDLVEVISGLEPGAKYVTENSFVIKADILKSGASHDH